MGSVFKAGLTPAPVWWIIGIYNSAVSPARWDDYSLYFSSISGLKKEVSTSAYPQSATVAITLNIKNPPTVGQRIGVGIATSWDDSRGLTDIDTALSLWRGTITDIKTDGLKVTITAQGALSGFDSTTKTVAGTGKGQGLAEAYWDYLHNFATWQTVQGYAVLPARGRRGDLTCNTATRLFNDVDLMGALQLQYARTGTATAWSTFYSCKSYTSGESFLTGSRWHPYPGTYNGNFGQTGALPLYFFAASGSYEEYPRFQLTAIAAKNATWGEQTYAPAGLIEFVQVSGLVWQLGSSSQTISRINPDSAATGETTDIKVKYDSHESRQTAVLDYTFSDNNTGGVYTYLEHVGKTAKYYDVNVYAGTSQAWSADSLSTIAGASIPTDKDYSTSDTGAEIEGMIGYASGYTLSYGSTGWVLPSSYSAPGLFKCLAIFNVVFTPRRMDAFWRARGVTSSATIPHRTQYQEYFSPVTFNADPWTKDTAVQAGALGDYCAFESTNIKIADLCPEGLSREIIDVPLTPANVISVEPGNAFELPASYSVTATDPFGEAWQAEIGSTGTGQALTVEIMQGTISGQTKITTRPNNTYSEISLAANTRTGSPGMSIYNLPQSTSATTSHTTADGLMIMAMDTGARYAYSGSFARSVLSGYAIRDQYGVEEEIFTNDSSYLCVDNTGSAGAPVNSASPFLDISPISMREKMNAAVFADNPNRTTWTAKALLGFCTLEPGDVVAFYLPQIATDPMLALVTAVSIDSAGGCCALTICPMAKMATACTSTTWTNGHALALQLVEFTGAAAVV